MSTVVYQYPHLDTPKRSGALCFDGVHLIATPEGGVPRGNVLSDAELTKVIEHPSYQRRSAAGVIVVQERATPSSEDPGPEEESPGNEEASPDYSALEGLSDYNIEGSDGELGAEDIVAITTDLNLLNQWLSVETRVTLQAIITTRIAELS